MLKVLLVLLFLAFASLFMYGVLSLPFPWSFLTVGVLGIVCLMGVVKSLVEDGKIT